MHSIIKCAVVFTLLSVPTRLHAQEVFKEISAVRLEGILKALNLEYTKNSLNDGTAYYDYKSNNWNIRLYNFKGLDLMVDIFLTPTDWKTVNDWNTKTKFSRARLHKDPKDGKESTVLESNLDLLGGVTEETISHFIRRFDNEIKLWVAHAVPLVSEEETFKIITPDRLEKMLADLKIQYKKGQNPKTPGVFFYDYARGELPFRLTTFGGADLMLDCVYPQTTLAKINEWNVKRSYVRAVLYPNNGNNMPYAQLEANLDCSPGVSESIVKYFITSFGPEASDFEKFLKGGK